MKLTREHFKLIAQAINKATISNVAKMAVIDSFVLRLRETNPLFDGQKFVDACLSKENK